MPALSIIPAAAVADDRLTDTQVRVLCALGTFTNRLGGSVWASINTLATTCGLSPRTVQRTLPVLLATGYLTRLDRPGRTSLYEIVLTPLSKGVTGESGGGDSVVTPPLTELCHPNDKKNGKTTDNGATKKTSEVSADVLTHLNTLWSVYPPRSEPYLWPPVRKAFLDVIQQQRLDPARLVYAARQYAAHVQRQQIEPRYVRGLVSFLRDGAWQQFDTPTVHGRTREEWARSGQDVADFDRLVETTWTP